jgi:hypothetical protein
LPSGNVAKNVVFHVAIFSFSREHIEAAATALLTANAFDVARP